MNTTRLEQTKIHKLFIEVFGSMTTAERILGVSKVTLYKVCAGKGATYNGADIRRNERILKGFENHSATVSELKKALEIN